MTAWRSTTESFRVHQTLLGVRLRNSELRDGDVLIVCGSWGCKAERFQLILYPVIHPYSL